MQVYFTGTVMKLKVKDNNINDNNDPSIKYMNIQTLNQPIIAKKNYLKFQIGS